MKIHGGSARKLTEAEADELRKHIQRVMSGSLKVEPYRLDVEA